MKGYFYFLISIALLFACKKDQHTLSDNYSPTPIEISYPSWVKTYLSEMPLNSENPLTKEGIELGRKLFYEKQLSLNNSQSCASCHQQANGFSDSSRYSNGIDGSKGDRNAMAISNLAWSNHLFWDGRRSSLEGQAHDPVTNPIEMKNDWNTVVSRLSKDVNYPDLFYKAFKTRTIDSNLVVKAIAQFERSLVSFNSRFDKFYFESDTNALNVQEKNGLEIFFNKGDCNHCHSDVLLSDDALRNNGLDATFTDNGLGNVTKSDSDNGKFKVVSLRNIEVTAPYMHDGRFKTLEDVVNQYNEGIHANSPNMDDNMQKLIQGIQLTNQEKQDLVAFLKTFTDSEFLTNKAFSNPN
jgi:cytochrome c peroxidase